MKQKKLLALIGSICLILVLAALPFMGACGPKEVTPTPTPEPTPTPTPTPTPEPAMEPVTLKMATMLTNPEDIRRVWTEKWGDAITEATDGLIKFEYYHGGQLVKAKELSDALNAGIVDAATWFVPSYTAEDYPFLSAMLALSFAYGKSYEVFRDINTEAYDLLTESLEAHNIKRCWNMEAAWGHDFYSAYPWDPEDPKKNFTGKKIRMTGGITAEIFLNYLGAEYVGMSAPEIYGAAQRGLIDGASLGPDQYMSTHMYEVFPYLLWANPTFTPIGGIPAVMRLDLFNSFPPSIQKQIMDVSSEIEEEYYYDSIKAAESVRDDLLDKGLIKQYVELDPEIRAEWKKDVDILIDKAMSEKFPDKWPKLKAVLDKYS